MRRHDPHAVLVERVLVCPVTRLFFPVPNGITYGQHWLNVKFEKSLLRVPFRILTKDEEKLLSKNYKAISQQVKDAFKKK